MVLEAQFLCAFNGVQNGLSGERGIGRMDEKGEGVNKYKFAVTK